MTSKLGIKGVTLNHLGVIYIRQVRKSSFTLKVRKRSYLYSMRFRTFSYVSKVFPLENKLAVILPCNVKNENREFVGWGHMSFYSLILCQESSQQVQAVMRGFNQHAWRRDTLKDLPSLETKHFTPKKKKRSRVGSFPFATIFDPFPLPPFLLGCGN